MFQLLIVDDETESLEWLEEMFESSDDAINVYTASTGRKALELLNNVKFDVVLTDIQMPGMSGLELYEKIKEDWPHTRIVFLTGYGTHEILYQVAQDRKIRYLVKTETSERIVDTVVEAYRELLEEQEAALKQKRNDTLLSKAKYWLEKGLIEQLLYGAADASSVKKQLEELELPVKVDLPVILFLARLDVREEVISYEEQEYILAAIQENMPRTVKEIAYILNLNYVLGIVQPRLTEGQVDWGSVFRVCAGGLESVKDLCCKKLDIRISAAIYREGVLLEQAGSIFHILRRKLIPLGKGDDEGVLLVNQSDGEARRIDSRVGAIKLPMLENYLEQGNQKGCREILRQVTAPLLSCQSMHNLEALELYYGISMVFIKYINANGWTKKIPFHIGIYPLTRVEDFADWSEAADYLMKLMEVLLSLMEEDEDIYKKQAILRVEEYIRNHLKDDLSLQVLADVGSFNASYLSRIFKQKYHCNLSDYIARERICLAKELLANTNEKINHIAKEVGYNTISSFNRVFRKSEGMAPAEYRAVYHIEK